MFTPGFAYSFLTRIHPTAVGNTKAMENPMSSVGLVGLSSGLGEIIGGKLVVEDGIRYNNLKTLTFSYDCS